MRFSDILVLVDIVYYLIDFRSNGSEVEVIFVFCS